MRAPAYDTYQEVELSQGYYYDVMPYKDGRYHVFMVAQIGQYFSQIEIASFADAIEAAKFSSNMSDSWARVCNVKS